MSPRRREDPREIVDVMLRLERLKQEADGIRASQDEREQMSQARALLRLKRLKQEWQARGGGE